MEPYPPLCKTITINRHVMATPIVMPIFLLNIGSLLHHNSQSKILFLGDFAACHQALYKPYTFVATDLCPDTEVSWYQAADVQVELLYTSVRTSHTKSYSNTVCGILFVYIRQENITICNAYHPPNSLSHIGKFQDCLTILKESLMKLEHNLSVLLIRWFQVDQCQIHINTSKKQKGFACLLPL